VDVPLDHEAQDRLMGWVPRDPHATRGWDFESVQIKANFTMGKMVSTLRAS
jgi:hypothetical protein